jgi:hypothetical protein
MKKRILGLLLTSTLMLGFTGCATDHDSSAWEYIMVTTNVGSEAETKINQLTEQGWHLVSMSAVADRGVDQPDTAVLVFKKHK